MRHGTYSICALDRASGELGVAVHSHWFSVGSLCAWASPGIGAVATQSVVEPAYGPRALERLAAGASAPGVLQELLAGDPLAPVRQVGVVDASGASAAHTGADCIAVAEQVRGDALACQANMMARPGVPDAMVAAYAATAGDLADRLHAALLGAERAGGDVRGRQSAALLVVPPHGERWAFRIDLRVDDHADPLAELGRLLGLHRAYELAGQADELLGEGRAAEAGVLYRRASELAPESDELLFWAGLAVADTGDLAEGVDAVRRAAALNPSWLVLLDRLTPAFAPAGEAVRRALSDPPAASPG
jgi:uncharacterized Ntn-hydrolase superfamily protein